MYVIAGLCRSRVILDVSTFPAREVSLNSTLTRGKFARSGQRITFTCVARNTTLLEWFSDDYVGPGHDHLPISSGGLARNQTRGSTVATRVHVDNDNGITVIVSQLHIIASEEFPTSSVRCGVNGQGPHQDINFTTTGM